METIADRYRVEREIGSGGIGTVYQAFDERGGRTVAIKSIDLTAVPPAITNTVSQHAAVLSHFDHPNLVKLYECLVDGSRLIVVMELLAGESLWQRVFAEVRLDDLRRIFGQVASALGYLHAHGIVHGDIKAGNIMILPGGSVKLLDFELAALGVSVGGTPAYMSPEQRAGKPLDARSDIFSLGAVLRFAVGEDVSDELPSSARKPSPGWDEPGVRAAWIDLIAKAMAEDSADRYQSAADLHQAIRSLPLPVRELPLPVWQMPVAAEARPAAPSSADAGEPETEFPSEPPTLMAAPEGAGSDMSAPAAPGWNTEATEPVASPPIAAPAPSPAFEMPGAAARTPDEPRTLWEVPPRSVLAGDVTSTYPELSGVPPGTASPGSAERSPAEVIEMSAYYPKEVATGQWYPFYAYVFVPSAAPAVNADAMGELASEFQRYRKRGQTASQKLARGTLVTAAPRIEGFLFNPPMATIGFFEDVHRLDFRLCSTSNELDRAFNGLLTFTVEGIIIADLPLSIFVGPDWEGERIQPITATGAPYDAIFCSYSHADEAIVRRVERAYRALGMEFLRDITMLKSGQDWNDELLHMIERSDIFQLFWSANAARSEYVAREWRHALRLGRDISSFIRPVYWRQPMPAPPTELARLHFAYDSGLHEEPESEERRGWRPWRRS